MLLSERLRELIDAAFTGLWIQTQEPDEALQEVNRLASQEDYAVIVEEPSPTFDPVMTVRGLLELDNNDQTTLLCLPNYLPYLQDPVVKQSVYRLIQEGKKTKKFVIILSPLVQIPVELEKYMVVVEHDLPTREDLQKIAEEIGTQENELPEGAELDRLIDAAAGLTRYEAEGAFSLALVREAKIGPKEVWEIKAGALNKNGTMKLHRGGETFANIGGLNALKTFTSQTLRLGNKWRAKGVMLLGPSGTGKSAFAKALGTETGRPTICMDIGALMGSLVGQTEQALRNALKIVDAMAPCIVFIDEIEKALAGAGTDTSGVTTRIVGTLLTWLNDHTTDVFVVCTANDISKLPPELTRAGRFDGIFFIDLPTQEQRNAIWPIYTARYELEEQDTPACEGWTGAEIEGCCRLAALQDTSLLEAAANIVPVSTTKADAIEALRSWATGRCLDADRRGVYTRNRAPQVQEGTRRAVSRRKTDLE